jgi:hypothetical protein
MWDMDRRPYASELFVAAGQALYGAEWKSVVARELGLQRRTVSRIAEAAGAGAPYRIATAVMDQLAVQVRERERALNGAWHGIKRGYAA